MLCSSCGRDSRNTRICEWCNKTMTAAPGATPGAPVAPLNPAPTATPLNAPMAPPPLSAPLPLNPQGLTPPPSQYMPTAAPLTPTQPVQPLNAPPLYAPPLTAQPLNAPEPTQGMPSMPPPLGTPVTGEAPASGRILRTTLTGEVIEVAAPEPTMMLGAPNPTANATAVGMMPPMAYPAGGNDGLPVAAISTAGMKEMASAYSTLPPFGERLEKCLAFALPILLACVWIIHAAPHLFMWVSFGAVFLLSIVMGATAVIPSFDEAYADVSVTLVLTFLFGPIIALVGHVAVGLMKQELNGAIVGLFLMNLLTRFLFIVAVYSAANSFGTFALIGFFGIVEVFAVFLSFGGWLISGMLRPLDAS